MSNLSLKFKASIILSLLLLTIVIGSFVGIYTLFSEPLLSVSAEEISGSNVVSDEEAPTFKEIPQTRWMELAYRLNYAEKDDYSSWTTSAKSTAYSSNSSRLGGYAINDEIFSLTGTDEEGSHRLEPVNSLSAANNISAVSYAEIQIEYFRCVDKSYENGKENDEKIYINTDTRKLSDVSGGLGLSGVSATVGKGKVLYRSSYTENGLWGSWNYSNLVTSGMTLRFTAPYNQIAIIYELREEGPTVLNLYKYHHIVGIYRFNVV